MDELFFFSFHQFPLAYLFSYCEQALLWPQYHRHTALLYAWNINSVTDRVWLHSLTPSHNGSSVDRFRGLYFMLHDRRVGLLSVHLASFLHMWVLILFLSLVFAKRRQIWEVRLCLMCDDLKNSCCFFLAFSRVNVMETELHKLFFGAQACRMVWLQTNAGMTKHGLYSRVA